MATNKSSTDSQFEPDFEAYKKTFDESFDESFDEESEKFEEIKKKKLIIALYGSVNSGKSSTINALTDQPLASVKAVAGHTKEIRVYKFTKAKNVWIADNPGLDDINEENSAQAKKFIEEGADIILFFFNAGVGASKSTVDAYEELQGLDKPIIAILNKIDMFHNNEQEEMEQDIKEKTGAKVVPISAYDKRGIDVLHQRIMEILKSEGKELLYLKVSKSQFKDEEVDKWITGAAISAAGVGAIPIPGADIIPLTTLQVGLAMKIAFIYERKVTKKDVLQLVAATVTGTIGRQIYRGGITLLKASGLIAVPVAVAVMAVAAAVAASVTYGFGHACKAYYKSGMTLELNVAGDIFRNMAKQYYNQKLSEGSPPDSPLKRLVNWWRGKDQEATTKEPVSSDS